MSSLLLKILDWDKYYWSKFVPDLLVLLLYFFWLQPLMAWQQQHLAVSCTLLMLLNIMAVGLGCFTFFTAFANAELLIKYKNSLTNFESSVLGLSAFISCFAFLWWLVPFAAVESMGVTSTGFIFGALAYFITFMGVVASSVHNNERIKISNSIGLKIINSVVTILFFFFSYSFLLMSLQHWEPGFMAAQSLAILCLFIFYLPLRFFLLFRPPFSELEYLSFVLSFVFLLFELFLKL